MVDQPEFDGVTHPTTEDGVEAPIITSAARAPTIYADGVIFATRFGSTVRVHLVETVAEAADAPHPGLKTRHVANIVMPIEGYRNTVKYLNEISEYFDEEGREVDQSSKK